mmetsp:Transcript_148252/g.412901  ORF Transcript_148252/g.412901 Transcript_148252/m.412901 type:complete len:244 (-) Transcript_148252:1166-1897(-)
MRRNRKVTTRRVARSGTEAKIVCTTTFRFSFREITRSGRSARRILRIFSSPPEPPTMVMMETTTTMPSSQFHPFLRYASLPHTSPSATSFTTISTMKMIAKTMSATRITLDRRCSGSRVGTSSIMHTVESRMHSKMKLSKTLIGSPRMVTLASRIHRAALRIGFVSCRMQSAYPYGHPEQQVLLVSVAASAFSPGDSAASLLIILAHSPSGFGTSSPASSASSFADNGRTWVASSSCFAPSTS